MGNTPSKAHKEEFKTVSRRGLLIQQLAAFISIPGLQKLIVELAGDFNGELIKTVNEQGQLRVIAWLGNDKLAIKDGHWQNSLDKQRAENDLWWDI